MKLKLALLATSAVALAAGGAVMAQSMLRVGEVTAQTAKPGQSAPVTSCESLAQQSLPQARVTSARAVAAGPFTPPGAGQGPAPQAVQLPAHCRVAATLTPSSDSDIKMELWLPAQGWNGKFMMVGNGGWNGSITYNAMAEPLRRGYAVASTDTGHEGGRGTFAFDHPEKLIDFAYRAVHETTVKGKQLTTAFYGGQPRYSYWNGCSSGGKQGLKEVQMYPADFDGVIAGAPANNWIRLQTQSLVANMANLPRGGGQPVLGQREFTILNRAALAQCDEKDGLKDNQIQDPRTCEFKASSVICRPGQEAGTCLTPDQAAAADKIYAPVRMRSGELVYPGMPVGSEMTWGPVIGRRWDTGADTYALAFNNKDWDFYTLNIDRDVLAAERHPLVGQLMATSPDMSAFKNRGGKIIQYHGWADPFIPTENSINYYESVIAAHGGVEQAKDFHRLFLVPAMGHCNGAYTFDWIGAIEEWVEHGREPDLVLGQRIPPPGEPVRPPPPGAVVFAPQFGIRPMCAYPNIAKLQGGNGEQPVDWMCVPGQRGSRPAHAPQRTGQRIASR